MFTFLISKQQIYPRYLLCCDKWQIPHNQYHITKWLCFSVNWRSTEVCIPLCSFYDFSLLFCHTFIIMLETSSPHHGCSAPSTLSCEKSAHKNEAGFWEKRWVVFTGLSLYFREKITEIYDRLHFCSYLVWIGYLVWLCPSLYSFLAQGQDHYDLVQPLLPTGNTGILDEAILYIVGLSLDPYTKCLE